MFANNVTFDYSKEPSRDILCIDCKSFYASVEAAARDLDPLTTKLVVMSYHDATGGQSRGSGLILASSPAAKKAFNISNVTRARDLPYPYPDDLVIVQPQMRLYMEKNQEINRIYKTYVDEANHHVFSIDESFLDVTDSLRLFKVSSAYEMAQKIQKDVFDQTGIYTTIGIGDNPFLAKAALDIGSKKEKSMIAEWRYEDVSKTLWQVADLTQICGIGHRMARRLQGMGINNVYDLAHSSYYVLKDKLGVMGAQLYAHAWGIDRSFLGTPYTSKDKSIGNSQVLPRDYTDKDEIAIVVKEMADQVGTRLRRAGAQTQIVGLGIGYSIGYFDAYGKRGIHKQIKVSPTNQSKVIAEAALYLLSLIYDHQVVRNISLYSGQLVYQQAVQLDLFESENKQVADMTTDRIIDTIRKKYGFKSLVYASSLKPGGRAIERSSLVGGHAGGMAGIEGEGHG
ncbi:MULTISPECIES: Y-family DNA polymerase [Aerococcus]|uniref:Excinuclease ABC subunit A n=1 Tax=Aerococcus viridans TaxID=1377 RepID=A0A2N6UCL1_9LACT|nr:MULTISPECIES: Y-family DNA polymerase [Aerococcus]OFU52278.1 excinuclease ABC subunit A [Aerococcus sp. HMSC10H05]PMC79311.1 excinuclease ABC subunit A [Aerococcus viridans]